MIFRLSNHAAAISAISKITADTMDGTTAVTIHPYKSNRSIAQNRLMWMWHTELGKSVGHHKDECHESFKWRFVRPILIREDETGQVLALFERVKGDSDIQRALCKLISSTDLSVNGMSEALREYDLWAGAKGYALTHPPDIYDEAIHESTKRS